MMKKQSGVLGLTCTDISGAVAMGQPPMIPQGYPPPYMMPDMGVTCPFVPGAPSNSECSCSDCADGSSTSSSSSSSFSSSSGSSSGSSSNGEAEPPNPLKGAYYNYEFCTCEVPLPESYVPKPIKKKKPKYKGPKAGIWCGQPCCAVAEYFPQEVKGVVLDPLSLKLKEPSAAVPPGTCCFRNDQLIFQVPDKGTKSDHDVLPIYNVGPDEKPLGVRMIKPEENPQLDPDNNTYLLTITKTDTKGKPAKLQLALKIPRAPDMSVSETERQVQYDPEDLKVEKGGPGKKGGKKKRESKPSAKSVQWSKKGHTKTTTKKTTITSKKSTKTSQMKMSGLKNLRKEMKKMG